MLGVLVAWMLASGFNGQGGTLVEAGEYRNLIPRDKVARDITEQAVLRSDTIRSLLRQLARSDVIVYVSTSFAACRDRPATRLFAASATRRYVSISLPLTTCRGLPSERPVFFLDSIAWFGHELRHAVEIGEARSVRDQDGVRRLFTNIGFWHAEDGVFETRAARDVEKLVAMEVSRRR